MQQANAKVLGILGGLGPMATVYFYELVTAHTAAGRDQDHIDIVISSKATTPDRTAFILGKSAEDPFLVMEKEAARLVTFGAGVVAIPCNTAHYFYEKLAATLPVPVLDMVGGTVDKAISLGCKKLGVLATAGTVLAGTYQEACRVRGIDAAVPDAAMQDNIMRVIYDDIKQGKKPDMQRFLAAAYSLFAQKCDMLVLGCTELSLIKKAGLLDGRYIDSMEVLAELAITACGKTPVGFSWKPLAL